MNDVAEILFPFEDVSDGFKIADIGFVMSDGMPLPEPFQILRCSFARKVVFYTGFVILLSLFKVVLDAIVSWALM